MPPTLALYLSLILLLGLLRFDPAKEPGTSLALWVPVIWIFFIASRLPSQWLGAQMGTAAQVLEEGNPLDRTIDLVLILLAVGVLLSRHFNWGGFFTRNIALMALLSFALFSVLWSDFPFVSFKRWFRDLGNYLVILVALSDPRPLEAVCTLLRRLCYLLIPLSVLLIKYFPGMSRQYETWTGAVTFAGAATSKNMLGALCLVSGIFFFWDVVTRWPGRKERRTKKILTVDLAFIGMTLWLLSLSRSATSGVCLVIGCLVIAATRSGWGKRHPTLLKIVIPASFILYLMVAFGLDLNGWLAGTVGRDPTLTDRTVVWKTVLGMHTDPFVGAGYESFWLGPRLQYIWQRTFHGANEAHNGYLETYLNLGLIGLSLLGVFLMASYRTTWRALKSSSNLASFSLALWTMMLFYNMTEAAFQGGFLWITFLLCAIAAPTRAEDRVPGVATVDFPGVRKRLPSPALEMKVQRR